MRLQGVVRRDGGLDDGGEAHRGVQPAGFARRPGAVRRAVAGMPDLAQLRKQQPTHGLVMAGDVRMDVDRAGEHDLAADVVGFVGLAALRRCDDAAVADPDVADAVASVRWVDDMAAGEPGQHGGPAGSCAAIRSSASATERAADFCAASSGASVPVAAR